MSPVSCLRCSAAKGTAIGRSLGLVALSRRSRGATAGTGRRRSVAWLTRSGRRITLIVHLVAALAKDSVAIRPATAPKLLRPAGINNAQQVRGQQYHLLSLTGV